MDAVQFGPREDLGYRRPPVTASFDDLRRRGLPEVLFVHSFLPEGVTICDVNVFAAMIEEAYNPPRTLLVDAPDSPITFTIRTRAVSMESLERGAAAGDDPADVSEGVDLTLSWLANHIPAAAGLLRLLAVLPPEPVPLQGLLFAGQSAVLPGPEAATAIGPLLDNPAAAGQAMNALHPMSLVRHAQGLRVQVHPLARAAIRAQLTAEESAHWQQAAAVLIEAAAAANPQLLPYARSVLGPTSDSPGTRGRRRIPGGWGPVSPDR